MVTDLTIRNMPVKKRREATKRLGLIKDFERFSVSYVHNGNGRTEALEMFCKLNNVSKSSLKRWIKNYRHEGLAGIADKRGGNNYNGTFSKEAFELFKSIYLTERQLSVKLCWQDICYVNSSQNKDWQIPSLREIYRFVEKIPLPVRVLHREGMAAYEAKCAPYIQIDPDSIEPGQVWISDHHQFNCWIRHRGEWIRPWITAWEDMRSRQIVGRHISIQPNQSTILLSFKRAAENYGPPDSVKIDNGKDYDSECWTGTTKQRRRLLKADCLDEQTLAGIYALMNIAVSFAIPYHPQSKSIERWFDTIDQQFIKTIDTYCGKDSNRKPENLTELLKSENAILQAYDLQSFTELVDQYIEVYNHSTHSGTGMDNKSPAEVMSMRHSQRCLAEDVLDLCCQVWSGELIIGKNGVNFKGLWYGQYDLELFSRQGKKVRVGYDPEDIRKINVYDAVTWKLITIAEQNRLIGYGSAVNEEHLREAMAAKSRAVKVAKQYRNNQLTANMDLTSLTLKAMQAGQQEKPSNKVTRLRPVKTVMDNQVKEHQRQKNYKAVKKAAGAEGLAGVLDIDFDLLKPKRQKTHLFDGVVYGK